MTGWIPERISTAKGSDQDDRFDKDKEFKRILDRFHQGHCLVTLATGDISELEAERAGLVPTHAYAMLDIREEKVSTYNQFQPNTHMQLSRGEQERALSAIEQ